jgi:hypothetical protein
MSHNVKRLPNLNFPFEFPKMIAQTGIESVSSTPAVSPAESASTAIWWLVPLAIACLALTWYLRRLNNTTQKISGRKDSQKKPSSKIKSVTTVLSDEPAPARDSDNNRQIKASKSSAKKKKKGQTKGQQNSKKLNEKQNDPKVVPDRVAVAAISSEKISAPAKPAEIAIESVSASLLPATTPVPAPVAAIFEPLRNVVPPRRKHSSLEDSSEGKKPQSVNEESVTRPASGGKFERMVPSTAYTRAAANRWPASMTTPIERTTPVRTAESKADSKPVASVTAVQTSALPQPVIPAAKGLKSFVSKVKSVTSPDTVAAGNVSEERNETEGAQ